MLEKECKYQKGVYKVQTFGTTQVCIRDSLMLLQAYEAKKVHGRVILVCWYIVA
jgi:hypothetical protein